MAMVNDPLSDPRPINRVCSEFYMNSACNCSKKLDWPFPHCRDRLNPGHLPSNKDAFVPHEPRESHMSLCWDTR